MFVHPDQIVILVYTGNGANALFQAMFYGLLNAAGFLCMSLFSDVKADFFVCAVLHNVQTFRAFGRRVYDTDQKFKYNI